jgi:hypothetical protein
MASLLLLGADHHCWIYVIQIAMLGVVPTVVSAQRPCEVPVLKIVPGPWRRQMMGCAGGATPEADCVIVGDRAVGDVAHDAPVPFSKITVLGVVAEKLVIS